MIKKNDSMNAPLRFIADNGHVFGQFYNSMDKMCHFAAYDPFQRPPTRYLCGHVGNFSPSRSDTNHPNRTCCSGCVRLLKQMSGLDDVGFNRLWMSYADTKA